MAPFTFLPSNFFYEGNDLGELVTEMILELAILVVV